MYDYIEGKFMGIFKDHVVVDHQGLGFRIFTSGNTMSVMPVQGDLVKLYVMQIVREDFIGLYGFASREELELFEKLLSVNGVGAKSALSLLSIASPQHLKEAFGRSDEKLLCRAVGIGKKTSQRLILELKDKFPMPTTEGEQTVQITSNQVEALEALLALGYTEKEAETVLADVPSDLAVEEILKKALLNLMN